MSPGPVRRAFTLIGIFFLLLWTGLGYTIYLAFRDHEAPLIAHPELSQQSDLQREANAILKSDWPESTARGRRTLQVELSTALPIEKATATISINQQATMRNSQTLVLDLNQAEKQPGRLLFALPILIDRAGPHEITIRIIYNGQYEAYHMQRFQVL